MLPNFIVIGAAKAGTTSLWGYLRDHPQVFMSEPKELNFFTTQHNWGRGIPWYEQHFDASGDALAVGEASGNYTNWPEYDGVPERMASVVPDVKLVYVIRQPIERMVSHYRYMRAQDEEDRSMADAFRERPMYTNVSRYATQIEQFLEHFDRQQLLVITAEDLRDARERTVTDVLSFLGVDATLLPDAIDQEFNRTDKQLHRPRTALRWAKKVPGYDALAAHAPAGAKRFVRRVGKSPVLRADDDLLTDELRAELEATLGDDVRRLRDLLGPTFDGWGMDVAARQEGAPGRGA